MCMCLFIHLILLIVGNGIMDMSVQIPTCLSTLKYLGYIIKSRNAESWGDSIFKFLKATTLFSTAVASRMLPLVMGKDSSFFIALSILVIFSLRHFWVWGFDNSNLDEYEVVACGFSLHFF